MARKRKIEEHENHERWLVSYADFITLLFAFFVVMYSISSVNEGKYRVLSSSMVSAFSQPAQSLAPIRYGEEIKSPVIQHKIMMENDSFERIGVEYEVMPTMKEVAKMEMISDEVEKKLKPLVDKDIVNIHKTNKGVEIEIKSNILFGSGQAVLQKSAKPPLEQIALVISKLQNPVNVEGFTDNQPIHTLVFPSNWELSAARAANVVHLFSKLGIAPNRMTAIGYGEYKPVASNDTPQGREKNRRINIIVLNRKTKDRQRLGALDSGKPVAGSAAEKLNPIGESVRKVMGQGGLLIPLPIIDSERSKTKSSHARDFNTLVPNRLDASNVSKRGGSEKNNKSKSKQQKPKLLHLPPPKMLPLGTGNNP